MLLYRAFLATCHTHLPLQSPGCLIYASMAVLKAANPPQPNAAAEGPALKPSMPPVKHPATMLFVRSFFALSPSTQHSVPEYKAPIIAKFFADEYALDPISFNPVLNCCFHGREVSACPWGDRGVSYAIEDMKRPKAPPRAKPAPPDRIDFARHDSMPACIWMTLASMCRKRKLSKKCIPSSPSSVLDHSSQQAVHSARSGQQARSCLGRP